MTSSLPKPGDLVQLDFRRSERSISKSRSVKFLQWNIERGYKLQEIVTELKAADADVVALQEVDIGCERSLSVDTGRHIAEALELNYVFFCEFEELHSPLRSPELQGGGVHGNALLSKYDMSDARLIHHSMHPVDWDDPNQALARTEPRKGKRAILAATVHTAHGPLLCYCLHLEVFCGMLARIEQFADVMHDSKVQIKKGLMHQAILGDLNTMAHGIARFSPKFCRDKMRFWSLGQSEAAFWDRAVFQVMDPNTVPEQDSAWQSRAQSGDTSHARQQNLQHNKDAVDQGNGHDVAEHVDQFPPGLLGLSINAELRKWGLSPQVCQDIVNPGFKDPFDPKSTVTLDNPAYRYFGISLMKGKLDWLLLRKMTVLQQSVGNHDYSASDHKWLSATVQFD